MIFDKELRAEVKIQRDAVHQLLKYHLPKCDLTKIGDTEIQLTWHCNPSLIRETALVCDMYGDWQFEEHQWESFDNYHYSTDLKLDYTSPANDIVNALMKLLK
tara:strand:- start:91 stop:399 length:309 start_codon:yes stop_codon:yes gene_type:complete